MPHGRIEPAHHGMFALRPDPNCSIHRYSACVISLEIAQAEATAAPAFQLRNAMAIAICVTIASRMCWIIPARDRRRSSLDP